MALNFEEGTWRQLGQDAGCVIYSSDPSRDNGTIDTADVTFFKLDNEFVRSYPLRGARVRVCGNVVNFPPVTEGTAPRSDSDG